MLAALKAFSKSYWGPNVFVLLKTLRELELVISLTKVFQNEKWFGLRFFL